MARKASTSNQPDASGLVASTRSATPRPSAAAIATGTLLNRAMAAAASPRNRRSGPNVSGTMAPRVGMNIIVANAATAPASDQLNIDIPAGSTPEVAAASGFDAAPRMAIPNRDRWRNSTSPTRRMGLRIAVAVYAWFTNSAPTSPSGKPGGCGKVSPWRLSPLMLRAKKMSA